MPYSGSISAIQGNVLNSYRSYTYNFSLYGLDKDAYNNASYLSAGYVSKFLIAKGGGKGSKPTPKNFSNSAILNAAGNTVSSNATQNELISIGSTNLNSKVTEFDQSSPGKFDLYIDNIEIETKMGFSEVANTTFPINISFDIFEPFSVSGFIESLNVAAQASGYPSYLGAPFLLQLRFTGYPDGEGIPSLQEINNSGRDFPITFNKITLDVTEQGTRYRCKCVPVGQLSFGDAFNKLKHSIKIKGKTVGQVLTNLMTSINELQVIDDTSTKSVAKNHDTYKIEFRTWDESLNTYRTDPIDAQGNCPNNDIANSNIKEFLKDNNVYDFEDPATTTKNNAYNVVNGPSVGNNSNGGVLLQEVAYNPDAKNNSIKFPENANINEIISSIIRDSEYLKNKIKNLEANGKSVLDENDCFPFWLINIESKDIVGKNDPVTNRPFRQFTYVVSPYKVHYTQLPGYKQQQADPNKIGKLACRSYNYVYTGKNIDILNFKMNFDSLFYEAAIPGGGNDTNTPAKTAAAPNNRAYSKQNPISDVPTIDYYTRLPPTYTTPKVSTVKAPHGGNAGQPTTDTYTIKARNAFRSLMENSKFSMVMGEMEIIGDPFYLVTGGVHNSKPVGGVTPSQTSNGEANHQYSQVIIALAFRNPYDINPLTSGGQMSYDSLNVGFQGYYRVNLARSTFKDGVFKQNLEVMRLIGLPNTGQTFDSPVSAFKLSPDPRDIQTPDVSTAVPISSRPTSLNSIKGEVGQVTNSIANIKSQINSSISGALSGVAAAVATVNVIKNTANQLTAKVQGINSNVANAASSFGISPKQIASLSPKNLTAMISTAKQLASTNINVPALQNQGVLIPSLDKIKNLPAIPANIKVDTKI